MFAYGESECKLFFAARENKLHGPSRCANVLSMEKPNYKELSDLAGISIGYASDILKGHRPMPRPLAIYLLRQIGWQHDCIADLTDAQITMLAELEPWTPPRERAA